MAHQVFISYSSKDADTAIAVCQRLEAHGISCWIAPRNVPHGASYGEAIIDALRGSRVVVLVLSSHANASKHVPKEIERAVSLGVPILPFRIEDVTPGKTLDFFIGSVHWLDALSRPLDPHLDQLTTSVQRLVGNTPEQPSSWRKPVAVPSTTATPAALTHSATVTTASPPPPAALRLRAIVLAAVAVVGTLLFALVLLYDSDDDTSTRLEMMGQAGRAAAASNSIAGCWRWPNNATVVIDNTGSVIAGPFTARWRHLGGRQYTFTWPEPIDTLTLSSDGRQLVGGNQYGIPVSASRPTSGALPGLWNWVGGATAVIEPQGIVRLGPFTGTWALSDRQRRVYQITWPEAVDTITLSDDGQRLEGSNQYGFRVSGTRLRDCG